MRSPLWNPWIRKIVDSFWTLKVPYPRRQQLRMSSKESCKKYQSEIRRRKR